MSRLATIAGLALITLAAVLGFGYSVAASQFVDAEFIGSDFTVYRAGGQAMLAGADATGLLYSVTMDRFGGFELPFTYPPFAALIFAPLAALDFTAGLVVINVAGILVGIALAWALWIRIFRKGLRGEPVSAYRFWDFAGIAIATFAILALGPWRETIAYGQINIILMALVSFDALAGPRWDRWRGILTGIAAGIKLTPLALGLYYLVRGDWKSLVRMASGFAATVVLAWIIRPVESEQFWTSVIFDASRVGGVGYLDNLSLRALLLHYGIPEGSETIPWLMACVVVVAAGAWGIRRASVAGQRLAAFSIATLVMLLISPISWSHHFVYIALTVPALVLLGTALRSTKSPFAVWCFAAALLALIAFYFSPRTIKYLPGVPAFNDHGSDGWMWLATIGSPVAVLLFVTLIVASAALAHSKSTVQKKHA